MRKWIYPVLFCVIILVMFALGALFVVKSLSIDVLLDGLTMWENYDN